MLHITLENTEGKIVRLGNSLTWQYSVGEDGVHFYHKGKDVTTSLKDNGANDPNLALKPGDHIYFDADGQWSKYGIDKPQKTRLGESSGRRDFPPPKKICSMWSVERR